MQRIKAKDTSIEVKPCGIKGILSEELWWIAGETGYCADKI